MLSDARKDVEARRVRLLAYLQELPALRQELLDARDVLIWIATYPDHAEQYGFPTALALGLRGPVERTLETKARVDPGRVVAALEADADALANAHASSLKEKLGTAPPPTPLDRAMWDADPAMVEWKKQERDRARRLAEWGRDPNKLAAELRE